MIAIKNLTKKFGNNIAVNNISLEINPGKIIGILGPNGAGKSTMIKSIVGGVKPTDGTVKVFSKSAVKNKSALSHLIGYMPQDLTLYSDLTALENVKFFADLHRVKNSKSKALKLLTMLGLENRVDDKVENFSGGMERRVSLACALVHEPEILILDEPTAGLDPELKRELWKLFKEIAESGKTVIVSTHLMEEAMLCNELVIIQKGEVISKGTPNDLISSGSTIVQITNNDGKIVKEKISTKGNELTEYLKTKGLSTEIENITIEKESLEDILIQLMNNKK